ncbi:MAG: hypothetical protein JWQ01_4798 [Massilia sp.]|nr:hypothetical protein [Massilia sp.]
MKTSELTGVLLDYWVAQPTGMLRMCSGPIDFKLGGWSPSTKWAHGGPIIESERINLVSSGDQCEAFMGDLAPNILDNEHGDGVGSTPLVAAMRAFVASKYGATVPDEAE